ncbi:hypothetical protein Q1695_003902 [Nippostrongylus brasiliensis]|nr:hypothetical protein Q1695_003902 [Nippostrongylus brasiliensis]
MLLLYLVVCAGLAAALPQRSKMTKYNESIARKLLNMAAGAYGDDKDECINRTYSTSERYRVILTINENCDRLNNTCGGYIAVSDVTKELVIVFRGTESMPQLILEADDATRPLKNFLDMGSVNRYFLHGHSVLWPPIERLLNDAHYKGYRITLTGHSLGGALAALAAARIAKQGFRRGDQITIYTFGEPRVGDLTFATNFDSMIRDSYRVVFHRDCIPHLPPWKDPLRPCEKGGSRPCDANARNKPYHHSTEIWYPKSMEPGSNYIECLGKPAGEDFTCSNKVAFSSHLFDQMYGCGWDHAHYFNVRVAKYGEVGCDHNQPEGRPDLPEVIMCFLSPSPDCEEHKEEAIKHVEVVPSELVNVTPPPSNESSTKKSVLPFFLSSILSIFKGR